jgi:hypothetical protein
MSYTSTFKPLSQTNISLAGCYVLEAFNPPPVNADSPAVQVMTDLSKVPAATITLETALEEANQSMILRGVRLLLVVEKDVKGKKIAGIITSVDVLGEKPVLVAQSRRVKHSDLRVDDVMVPVKAMEALNISDVNKASVGHIVATLKAAGRAHALVIKEADDGMQSLLGIFSASQIARQLGVQVQTHEMARTFAEIEAVISGL